MKELMVRGTGKRAKIPNIDCYGKTGTSNDSRDASFIGFAYPLVAGVWVGNDDNAPMHQNITGGTLPAQAWKEFMMTAFGLQKKVDEIEIKPNDTNNIKNKNAAMLQKKKKHRKISDMLK